MENCATSIGWRWGLLLVLLVACVLRLYHKLAPRLKKVHGS